LPRAEIGLKSSESAKLSAIRPSALQVSPVQMCSVLTEALLVVSTPRKVPGFPPVGSSVTVCGGPKNVSVQPGPKSPSSITTVVARRASRGLTLRWPRKTEYALPGVLEVAERP
jgi:hypothetical protein